MLNAADWAFWLMCLGVVAVNIALVYAAWWALFADRCNGRRRCPRCWYDLSYSPGMTCAECGFTARREVQFQRTRRRYGIAFGAMIASAAIGLYVSERASQQGVPSMLPTRVLLWIVPIFDTSQHSIMRELVGRANMDRLSDSQWVSLLSRCADGDWWNKPPSHTWAAKYGNFILITRSGLIERPELETPLLDIPPRIDVFTREVWPAGHPVAVSVQVSDWWPLGMECRVRAAPQIPGVEPTVFFRSAALGSHRTGYVMHLPPLGEAVRQFRLNVQIERRRMAIDRNGNLELSEDGEPKPVSEWEPVANESITVTSRSDGTVDDMLEPTSSEELDELVRRVFAGGVVQWARGPSPVRFNINSPATFTQRFDDTAIGLAVELMHGEQVARQLNMWWIAGASPVTANRLSHRFYGFEVAHEDLEMLNRLSSETAGEWQLRVRSDPALALRAIAGTKYWSGEVTVPVQVTHRDDMAPPRPWRNP